MTQHEYSEYEKHVSRYLAGCTAPSSGACQGCEECAEYYPDGPEGEAHEDPHFSWHPCEICGVPEGGDRYAWHCLSEGKIVHGACCVDCMYYLEYGRLDDTTMAEIETSK